MAHKRPTQRSLRDVHVPAPVGGQDAVSVASAMPSQFCPYVYNLLPGEKGLEVRPGYAEFAIGMEGAASNTLRTVIGYTGSTKDGLKDKIFCTTDAGIRDATAGGESWTGAVDFPLTARGDAGFGSAVVMSTSAGRFILYCDEAHGLYIYTESTETWAKVSSGTRQQWASSTAYAVGNKVAKSSKVYVCTVAGTSGASGPSGTGTSITDGTVTWDYETEESTTAIGPSLADQNLGHTADPANFVHVTVWKSRVWFTERDTARAWYLDTNSIHGAATSFNFGSKMAKGGPLVGLFNWSYDGGSGLDTLLVGLSVGGDVVIYQGTDPNYADTFGLKGCWYVGAVPVGRRFVTDTGGDLLIISALGVVPLSRLVVGGEESDVSNTLSARIAPVFARYFNSYSGYRGWTLHVHPTANGLLVIIPVSDSGDTIQLFYSFATKGWFHWRDLPIVSVANWNRELYFGTTSGSLCRQTGHVDAVEWADNSSYSNIAYSGITAFQNLGNARNKQVQLMRADIDSDTPHASCECTARYDFSTTEPTAPSGTQTASGGFDTEVWDTATWDMLQISQPLSGATGMGRAVAVAFRGNAKSRTVLIGFDVQFTEGGSL